MLKVTVGVEFPDDDWHPVSTKHSNSSDNIAVHAIKCRRDMVDFRHERLTKFTAVTVTYSSLTRIPIKGAF